MKDERKVRKDEVAGHARIESDQLEGFNEEILESHELDKTEGGWCDYTCIACASNGVFSF